MTAQVINCYWLAQLLRSLLSRFKCEIDQLNCHTNHKKYNFKKMDLHSRLILRALNGREITCVNQTRENVWTAYFSGSGWTWATVLYFVYARKFTLINAGKITRQSKSTFTLSDERHKSRTWCLQIFICSLNWLYSAPRCWNETYKRCR